jgi:hypothetical protein
MSLLRPLFLEQSQLASLSTALLSLVNIFNGNATFPRQSSNQIRRCLENHSISVRSSLFSSGSSSEYTLPSKQIFPDSGYGFKRLLVRQF